jgi:nitroimidazol reductase NimA-like FMN-containing flavoprotein (pyridoxamine 5'-phosphate oxidase superfamily)
MTEEHAGVEIIEREECLRLLGEQVVGRLGFVDLGQPLILPVNFELDDDVVVFRPAEGTKLRSGLGSEVCFEVDGVDRVARAGWSVVIEGVLEEATLLSGRKALDHTRAVATEPWAPGTKAHWQRVVPSHISGRRIRPDGGQAARRSDHDDPLAGSQTHVGTLARPVTSIPVAASVGDAVQVLRGDGVPCVPGRR